MADDKKSIGPEAGKPGEVPPKKKTESVKDTPPAPQPPVVEAAPKVQPTPTVESKPEEKAALAPKVLDFSAAVFVPPLFGFFAPGQSGAKKRRQHQSTAAAWLTRFRPDK